MRERTFDYVHAANAVWIGAAVLFLPLFAVFLFDASIAESRSAASGEVTVGLAVIIRATARRFLRSASGNLMRTTVGALGRASARAATRRLVKAATRVVFGAVVRPSAAEETEVEERAARPAAALLGVAIGTVALMLSFWGVLHVAPEPVAGRILRDGRVGMLAASILAGLPLLVYVALHAVLARRFQVEISYKTELDGLLLQGYFTGAGSFLPMTTDVDYAGSARGKCWLATWSLLGLLALHVALTLVGRGVGSDHLELLGGLFLVYAFIYVFPITPLEGQFIWAWDRRLWALVAGPILLAFVYLLPADFAEIL